MKICKNCKIECADDVKFCNECGYHFTEDDKSVQVCENCNTHNSVTSKFCQECGEPLDKTPAQTETVQVNEKPVSENESTLIIEPVNEKFAEPTPVQYTVSTVAPVETTPVNDNGAKVNVDIPQPVVSQTETASQSQYDTEQEPVKEFDIANILANDPYYDDVPLEDDGETKTPIDKENLKKAILIVVGALFIVAAITAYLVVTS